MHNGYYLSSYEKYGYGPFLVRLIKDGKPIGSAGLYKRKNLDFPDIDFAFLPEFTKQGFAFESSKAVMNYTAETLELTTFNDVTLHKNTSSLKLLRKIGLKEIGTFTNEDGEELVLFSN